MAKARARIKNLRSVFNAIEKVFNDTVQEDKMLNDIGKEIVKRVKTQTQIGNDLKNEDKQPSLSDGYINYRSRLRQGKVENTSVKPSKLMQPERSQLTLTGQLLESLKYEIDKRKATITMEPTGTRKPTKRKNDITTNKELTLDLAKRGREYLGLDKTGVENIRQKVLRVLRRNIRKFNKAS